MSPVVVRLSSITAPCGDLQFLYESSLIYKDNSIVRLNSADLSNAHLSVVNLNKANLRKADLYKANPSEAKLLETNLSEAYLQYANLSGANLGEARYLTREQIDEAYGDKRTELPQHRRHPKHWCNNTDYKSNGEYKYLDARIRVALGSCRSLLGGRMRMCVNATCGESGKAAERSRACT